MTYNLAATNARRALKGVSLGSKLYAVRIITSKASTATSFKVSSHVWPSWNSPYNAAFSGWERLANGARRNGTRCPSGPTTAMASQRSSSVSQLSHLLSWACLKASDMAHLDSLGWHYVHTCKENKWATQLSCLSSLTFAFKVVMSSTTFENSRILLHSEVMRWGVGDDLKQVTVAQIGPFPKDMCC